MNNVAARNPPGGKLWQWVAVVGVLVMSGMSLALARAAGSPVCASGEGGPLRAQQGQVLTVTVPEEDREAEVRGVFMGRAIPFFPDARPHVSAGYVALLGIDVQDRPGAQDLTIMVASRGRERCVRVDVSVGKGGFPVQRLRLPREKVDLDENALRRWKEEQREVKAALADDAPQVLWQEPFREPVQGPRTGVFGSVRILNGQPRAPHNGIDIAAPAGAEVAASSDGVVRLTVDHLLSGKGIFLDHGFGLYTMYFHLSDVLVRIGDPVKAGQAIGRVGATGRASGPHLHWGARLNGARVDPESLLALRYRSNDAPSQAHRSAAP